MMPLRDNLVDRLTAVHVEPLSTGHFERERIEAELTQYCRVDIGHVVRVLDSVKADFVGRSMDHAPLEPTTSKPSGEPVRVMVTAITLSAR